MAYFKKLNNILGWIVFLIATSVYLLTLEPTASFWDCGEFIACSAKLQVPHPPGTPFFLLVNRMFAMLAPDASQIAFMVNVSSALCSGFTILFLFWSISLLALKFFNQNQPNFEPTKAQTHSIMWASAVGALAYTFSDSFWFSAVEAEVYAMSSFLTGFIFWAMLKWDRLQDIRAEYRWLLLIAYLIGLSIGVHPLNLLTIPALSMIYYFKKAQKITIEGTLYAILIGSGILLFLIWLIPGLPTFAKNVEVFFVNTLGLPFNSGIIFLILAIVAGLTWGIWYSIQKQKPLLNTILLGVSLVLIGYASYGIILIRSSYNPPIDENNPEDLVSLISYLNREQYGSRPLLFGPVYTEKPADYVNVSPIYTKDKEKGKYVVYRYNREPKYEDDAHMMFFPRLYSSDPYHVSLYERYLGLEKGENPSFLDNLRFFFTYQLGHMYWRYFGWNFIGRESDIKDAGVLLFGNDTNAPDYIKNNKARNRFFAVPFILGMLGLAFNIIRNKQTASMLGVLFFLTGIALVIYLNSPPVEPRERDYIYVGSFYVFAIWIGFGMLALIELIETTFLQKQKQTPQLSALSYKNPVSWAVAGFLGVLCVFLMAWQGWDDHNRSRRYYSVDSARNLLSSCEPNAILFTGGDNDTFPLWYVQEVEGFRTDVRVCNTSLLGTDWYISQMKQAAYDSDPLPISLKEEHYRMGINDVVFVTMHPLMPKKEAKQVFEEGVELKQYMDLVVQNNKYTQIPASEEDVENFLPSKRLLLDNSKDIDYIKNAGFLPPGADTLLKYPMYWELPKNRVDKDEFVILNIIANNRWRRPIYFAPKLSDEDYVGLKDYMQVEGLAYRLLPVPVGMFEKNKEFFVNADLSYELLMKEKKHTFKGKEIVRKMYWRNLDDSRVYYNEDYFGFISQAREHIYEVAQTLIEQGKKEKAKELMLFSLKTIPIESVPYDVNVAQLVPLLYEVGENNTADKLYKTIIEQAKLTVEYALENYSLRNDFKMRQQILIFYQYAKDLTKYKPEEAKKCQELYKKYAQILNGSQRDDE
ncbi:MAG: DUF2723 domain-containing protein [Raineya sp.]|nr:DUF2723 domain-containing protein [Raineya sp.]MDW8296055.1 DUF2723 domain-containing protein [Raineya sp.]